MLTFAVTRHALPPFVYRWAWAGLVLVPMLASAQTPPPPPPPDAGSVLQQVQPTLIPPPRVEQAPPVLNVPRAVSTPTSGGGAKVRVKGFRIAGLAPSRLPALQASDRDVRRRANLAVLYP